MVEQSIILLYETLHGTMHSRANFRIRLVCLGLCVGGAPFITFFPFSYEATILLL